jgi:hypothetical protein
MPSFKILNALTAASLPCRHKCSDSCFNHTADYEFKFFKFLLLTKIISVNLLQLICIHRRNTYPVIDHVLRKLFNLLKVYQPYKYINFPSLR